MAKNRWRGGFVKHRSTAQAAVAGARQRGVGRVTQVGPDVTRFRVGDAVAVGCLVDSCQECDHCHQGEEQFCTNGRTDTYNAPDRITGENTYGGYAKH